MHLTLHGPDHKDASGLQAGVPDTQRITVGSKTREQPNQISLPGCRAAGGGGGSWQRQQTGSLL